MASASTKSARSLFEDSRNRLVEKVQINLHNVIAITKQIQKGSQSNELLAQSANQLCGLEKVIEKTEKGLKKFPLILKHLNCQEESIGTNVEIASHLHEKITKIIQECKNN